MTRRSSVAADGARVFGSACGDAFAIWDRVEICWLDATAVGATGPSSEFDRKWPAYGLARGILAIELSDAAHEPTGGPSSRSAGAGSLLPTPSACEPDTWRYIDVVDKDGAPPSHPNQRFYNKATGQIVQKTLEHVALTWPTPTVQDARNNGGPAQHTRRTPPLNAVADGPLNPVWVEWLMGFPPEWTRRSAPGATEPSHLPAPDREAAAVAAREAATVAARSRRSRRRSPHDGGEYGAAENLRSPRHPEVAS